MLRTILGAVAAALVVALVMAEPGAGRGGAPAEGEIAFSHNGAILVMSADGSGRRPLTAPADLGLGSGGDSSPSWSPDGTALVFEREAGELDSGLYVVDLASGEERRLTGPDGIADAPAWSPDGSRIAYGRAGDDGERTEIVSVAAGGGDERVLVSSSTRGRERVFLTSPAWAPEGDRIAYVRSRRDRIDGREYIRPSAFVVSAAGGTPRLLARDAGDPDWSPDGRRLAVESVRDRNGEDCYEQCTYRPELYVMNADGSDPVRLTRNRGNDQSPSWSPDGGRIVFASDRNYPAGLSSEIYSVRADGSCLRWLTNGSPGSSQPAWRRSPGETSAPGGCGPRRRAPRVDIDLTAIRVTPLSPAYWLGPARGGGLLSSATPGSDREPLRANDFIYDDCGRYRARDCPPPLQIQNHSVCSRHATLSVLRDPEYSPVRSFTARGRLLIDIGQGDLTVIRGAADVRVFPARGGRAGRRQALAAIEALRPFGAGAAREPRPALPRPLLRSVRRSERALRRQGSPERAARALGMSARLVRRQAQFARALRGLGDVRALDCP